MWEPDTKTSDSEKTGKSNKLSLATIYQHGKSMIYPAGHDDAEASDGSRDEAAEEESEQPPSS